MIGICVDSNAQVPADIAGRYGMVVVPLTVTIDGVDYLEHVDLDAGQFYDYFAGGHRPHVSTAAPSPRLFLRAWQSLADAGASEILSIHIGSGLSGTLNAAHVALPDAPLPVTLVDTESASFAVAAAAWAAAESVASGAAIEEAARVARETAGRCENVFVVGTLELAQRGGRLSPAVQEQPGIPVLRLVGDSMATVGVARSSEEAAETMAREIVGAGDVVVGVGHSDSSSLPTADALAARLRDSPRTKELVRYRVGPSVGAHTGPGTAGAVYWRPVE